MSTLKLIDTFCGIGGFSLAAHAVGIETVLFCDSQEHSPYVWQVIPRHFPGVVLHDDVRTLTRDTVLDILGSSAKILEGSEMAGKLKKLTEDQAAEAVKMYDSGMSIAPIAEFYGVSRQGMWDLLRRRTTMRPQKRAGTDSHFYRGTKASDRAQNLLEQALARGVVERQTHCSECGDSGTMRDGRTSVQAHHDDYNKPLEVRWLCQKCHHAWHKENKAVEVTPTEAALVLTAGFP